MERKDELIRIFSREIREILMRVRVDFAQIQEIRMRVNAPLLIVVCGQEYFVTREGKLRNWKEPEGILCMVTREQLQETLEYISRHSLYAFEEEIRQGFLTIPGGHRIGIAGQIVMDDGKIRTMKYISFLNVRLAHQIRGCADAIMPVLYDDSSGGEAEMFHTLIISPPRCGKTTLLRDMIRQISNGSQKRSGMTVGVVDERSEIGACYQGVPQNDLGIRTDVLDACPKAKGMMMLIRSMSPRVIAVDEIGGYEDLESMRYVMNCGCKILATIHGTSYEDVKQKPIMKALVEEQIFERYIVLDQQNGPGHIRVICDANGNEIEREE